MRIIYPYNEILPRKKAHDVFIFQECAAFAECGWDVTLLCGKGSGELHRHYEVAENPHFRIKMLPIIRKNNFFNISWNRPFFYFCQREIEKTAPDWVFLSVPKQARYHLQRKVPGVRYVYEVHELCDLDILKHADLILTTTLPLKKKIPFPHVEVVPLAVKCDPLPTIEYNKPFTLMYVGQLYPEQGLPLLLKAMSRLDNIKLKVIGGTPEEIAQLSKSAPKNVEFLGFHPPSTLPEIVKEAHAFVAPFENVGRMPYVAHTKLFEYAEWGRPFIAPDLPIVREHFSMGVEFFEPGNPASLAASIRAMEINWEKHRQEVLNYSGQFSWENRINEIILKANASHLSTHR